jgi:tetratricopeptide (TPR) repeat protein
MGYISLVYDHDRARAKSEFERAIELDPSYPTAHQWFGLYYDSIGDTEAAIASVKRAREQDSLSLAVNIALAESYYFARDYERAAVQAKAAIELDNSSALAHFNLGRVYVMQKRYSDAVGEFQLARNSSPNAATLVPLGYANALAGNAKEAGKYLKELDLLSKSQYVPAIYYAMLYTGLNDKEQAFHYLDKALGEHCDYLVFLQQDPMADPLRGDARFLQITSQIAGP